MFDRDYAARQVLGRHGRGASDADVKLFADALADNLMQRYGSSLLDFNTKLRVRVKSETPLPRGLGVKVSSEMLRSGGDADPGRLPDAPVRRQWKVFDVMVEGVSFVQTFRQQFDAELQTQVDRPGRRRPARRQAAGRCRQLRPRVAPRRRRAGVSRRVAARRRRRAVAAGSRPLLDGVRRIDLRAV